MDNNEGNAMKLIHLFTQSSTHSFAIVGQNSSMKLFNTQLIVFQNVLKRCSKIEDKQSSTKSTWNSN